VFPSASLVKQGHLKIMDSVKANNSCAKIILFAGWGLKNGMPPNGGNTGLETIKRILTNYKVMNKTMKETVAPIGVAWTKCINYLPLIDLWSPDEAHPSYAGSYLTASVIFSSIFNQMSKTINYDGSLTPATAYNLRAFSDTSVFNSLNHVQYNLGGARKVNIQGNGSQLSVAGAYTSYNWYKENVWISNLAVLTTTSNGYYRAELTEMDSCVVKTCNYLHLTTAVQDQEMFAMMEVYPNPVTGNVLSIKGNKHWESAQLVDLTGHSVDVLLMHSVNETTIHLKEFAAGSYVLQVFDGNTFYRKKIVLLD
jgi:hypothetical protein